ncbi:DUF4422 domain-containing protein [Solitalea lacus]|uniref:DUF4422 domain-containing protein n=1 Tax=Solitalea lacus TaxID=2911172 RepID=UPI001EDB4645|nr:DUF4422 domain-containing protein [Solitalea lacus]UKJ07543.1 DUF4422 domain-containing protein [Solitalea lacus]
MIDKSIKLYSVFHKPFIQPKENFVIPIHAGKALSNQKLDFLEDNTGDNISELNSTFCELTAQYWIWKNEDRSRCDIWGMCHYRRYFTTENWFNATFKNKRTYTKIIDQQNLDNVVSQKLYTQMQEILQTSDVILPKPMVIAKRNGVKLTLEEHYSTDHFENDWKTTIDVITEKYPDYLKSIPTFNNSTTMSFFNMMIAPWKIWDAYLTWLFDVLLEVKNRIKVSDDPYQKRVFGFLSERLINLYVHHNKLKIAYLPVAVFDNK